MGQGPLDEASRKGLLQLIVVMSLDYLMKHWNKDFLSVTLCAQLEMAKRMFNAVIENWNSCYFMLQTAITHLFSLLLFVSIFHMATLCIDVEVRLLLLVLKVLQAQFSSEWCFCKIKHQTHTHTHTVSAHMIEFILHSNRWGMNISLSDWIRYHWKYYLPQCSSGN